MSGHLIVAVDGPAGAGKSTVARKVADRLHSIYIDSGAMYRCVALWASRLGVPLDDAVRLESLAQNAIIRFEPGSTRVYLNEEDVGGVIRTPDIAAAASKVAQLALVRRALVPRQRLFAKDHPVVMEGRDIGTVVFPEAQVKIFLDASPEIRAARRVADFRLRGVDCDPNAVEKEIRERDQRDRTRADSPLIQAPDAHLLDSTHLSAEDVEEEILRLVRNRTSNGKDHQSHASA
jgi:CMP/dCMP kinase